MADKSKIVKNIKDGGSLLIYIGTASLMKPIITRDNDERGPVGKIGALASGTVISCGIANFASKYFGKIVDEVADFVSDVMPKKKNPESGKDQTKDKSKGGDR